MRKANIEPTCEQCGAIPTEGNDLVRMIFGLGHVWYLCRNCYTESQTGAVCSIDGMCTPVKPVLPKGVTVWGDHWKVTKDEEIGDE